MHNNASSVKAQTKQNGQGKKFVSESAGVDITHNRLFDCF